MVRARGGSYSKTEQGVRVHGRIIVITHAGLCGWDAAQTRDEFDDMSAFVRNLSQRDRSLVTVSALIAMNRPDQLRSHLARARENGVTQDELIETITHLAFYAGWPNAMTAISVAKEVFQNN